MSPLTDHLIVCISRPIYVGGGIFDHHEASLMGSMFPPDLDDQTPPNAYCALAIESHLKYISDVDKLELESSASRRRALEHAITIHVNASQLTEADYADIERRVDAAEFARREPATTITITNPNGATESAALSSLPQSYKNIRNLLLLGHHPVYRTALAEWRRQVTLFAARVERKIKRTETRRNEIYNVIGFYSVFQGVLLTATSQSNYLHCRNVWVSIALSAFASLSTLVHICRKFDVISGLRKTIALEEISLKEAKARIYALKNKGEAFRFSDFLEDKKKKSRFPPRYSWWRSQCLVPVAVFLFSVFFVISHWLILCRPGPADSTVG